MEAIVLGAAGKAIRISGDHIESIDFSVDGEPTPISGEDLRDLLVDAPTIDFVDGNIDDIRETVRGQNDDYCALTLTLMGLDADLSGDVRVDSAKILEGLLSIDGTREFIESVLLSKPLPNGCDIWGFLTFAKAVGAKVVLSTFSSIAENQVAIQLVAQAFDSIPIQIFGDRQSKLDFQSTAIRAGMFGKLVICLAMAKSVDRFLYEAGSNPSITSLKNHRTVLKEWVKTLQPIKAKVSNVSIKNEEFVDIRRVGKARQRGMDRGRIFENVESQKEFITRQLQRGNLRQARRLVNQLVDYQIQNGDPGFAAKSLCDLAVSAKYYGCYSLQMELLKRAIELKSDDGRTWAQYADVLLHRGSIDEAIKAFDEAAFYGEDIIVQSGRAEVLRAQGKLDDALAAFDAIVAEHPEDVFAKNGRAEVLKAQGKLDDALAAYEATAAEHPEEVVAKNGRAEVLKAQGKLDEALAAFDANVAEHPGDVVAKNGRAEVLRAQGKLDDALAAYESIILDHPEDFYSKNGRAEVLKAQGKLDDALAAYGAIVTEHPEDVVAKSGRAEVLKAQRKLDDALAAFVAVVAEHPENVVAQNGLAEVLKAQGKFDDALGAFDAIVAEHPENVVAKTGRAEVLKAQGKLNDALAAFDAIVAEHHENVVAKTGRAEVLKAQGKLDDALAAFDAIVAEHPEDVVAKCGRAEVLKAQGKLDDALAAFDVIVAEHPESVVPKNGRAEVLKAQGKLDGALAVYDANVAEHPEDVVAKSGRAEVLKAQGKLEDALGAFDAIVAEHPENVVAKCGRAEVLKAQGKLDDALAAFDVIVAEHPENVVAKCGRAEVFKAQGKLDDALAAYESNILKHPEDVVSKVGYASVLVSRGNYDKAFGYLSSSGMQTHAEWVGYHIRGMAYLRMGRTPEAVNIFKHGLANSPWIRDRQFFQTALSIALLKQRNFQGAAEELEQITSPELTIPTNLLRLHCYGAGGDIKRAAAAHRILSNRIINFAVELTDELASRYIKNAQPKHDEAWLIGQEIDFVLLAA